MFRFNATVMGYGNSEWMAHVLDVFPTLVVHAADPARTFTVKIWCFFFVGRCFVEKSSEVEVFFWGFLILFVEDSCWLKWLFGCCLFLLDEFLEECKCSDIKSSHLVKCFGSKIIWRDSGKDRFFNFIMEWLRAREFNPQITWSMYGIFTYSWLKFYGKCRWTYHTWILWVTLQQGKYVGQTCVHPYHPWSGKIYFQIYTKTYLKPHISSISQCLPLSLSLSLYIRIFDYIEPRDPVAYVGPWQVGAPEKLPGFFPQKVCWAINSIAWNSIRYCIYHIFVSRY